MTLYSIEGDATSLADTYTPSSALNKKVSLWRGDITRLEIDAIVNSVAKGQLQQLPYNHPIGTVCNAVHYAAGPMLQKVCQSLRVYQYGEAVVTNGYNLPAKCELAGADPEGVRGVRTNPPGHLRLHIVCAYLAWSSNNFWPAEPLPDENTS